VQVPKNKGNNQSLRPSGFARAFGRAVVPVCGWLDAGLKPSSNPKGKGKGKRFTARLTSAFSKKVENHAVAVALHFIHYNFARIHKTLRITPAMAAGISDPVWSYEEIAGLA
jgi:hypothetical protein